MGFCSQLLFFKIIFKIIKKVVGCKSPSEAIISQIWDPFQILFCSPFFRVFPALFFSIFSVGQQYLKSLFRNNAPVVVAFISHYPQNPSFWGCYSILWHAMWRATGGFAIWVHDTTLFCGMQSGAPLGGFQFGDAILHYFVACARACHWGVCSFGARYYIILWHALGRAIGGFAIWGALKCVRGRLELALGRKCAIGVTQNGKNRGSLWPAWGDFWICCRARH